MEKQTRDKLRELAGIAKDKGGHADWWTFDSLREYVCDESLELDNFDYNYIASISPDVLIQLLDKLDKADALASLVESEVEYGHGDACIAEGECCWNSDLSLAAKAYRKAGESE